MGYPQHTVCDGSYSSRDIAAVARGDRDALGRLYGRYARPLITLARRVLRDSSDAEDLVQDVFVEVFRRAGDYDPQRGSVLAWLRTRTYSRALDKVKAPRFKRATTIGEEPATLPVDPILDRPRLLKALFLLPPDQRKVVLLGYFNGFSTAEIAQHEGIPLGTVKSRTISALTKLRAQLNS